MIEVAVVLDNDGQPVYWHEPPGRSSVAIPDSRDLWDAIWENRDNLMGVAHSHPGTGTPVPSQTDVTTFVAVEKALGRKLVWPIITQDRVAFFQDISNVFGGNKDKPVYKSFWQLSVSEFSRLGATWVDHLIALSYEEAQDER